MLRVLCQKNTSFIVKKKKKNKKKYDGTGFQCGVKRKTNFVKNALTELAKDLIGRVDNRR